jgi:hypothetical protein
MAVFCFTYLPILIKEPMGGFLLKTNFKDIKMWGKAYIL